MVSYPEPFADANLRAFVRVVVVLLPALWLAKRYGLRFGFWPLNWRAIGIGVTVAMVILGGNLLLTRPNGIVLPTGFAIYFNFIIGSPIAEELLFRGVILQRLDAQMGKFSSIVLSSLLFLIYHWPRWLILDAMTGTEFLSTSAFIFGIGVLLALLYRRSQSLWSPIVYHILNNFVSLAVN